MNQHDSFLFRAEHWKLFGNVLNEVLHGFRLPNFEQVISASERDLKGLLNHILTLQTSDELTLDVSKLRAVRNALRETIRELGIEEFHTRTGYEFEDGKRILNDLNRLLRDSAR
jgi:hypothetical protein